MAMMMRPLVPSWFLNMGGKLTEASEMDTPFHKGILAE
jgi:hypothetical protein